MDTLTTHNQEEYIKQMFDRLNKFIETFGSIDFELIKKEECKRKILEEGVKIIKFKSRVSRCNYRGCFLRRHVCRLEELYKVE